MPQTSSILVVGAGVFGVTAAIELRRRGHPVTLVDPGPLPHVHAASTDISKIVRMDYTDDFYISLMEPTLESWRACNRRWGEELYHEDGLLLMTRDPLRPGTFEGDCFAHLQRRGHPVERVRGAALRERAAPLAADAFTDGYFNPRAGWAESGKVMVRLLADAEAAGVALRANVLMAGLLEEDARIAGITTTAGDRFRADDVLIAAGAWTPVLLPHLANHLRVVGQPVWHFQPADVAPFRPPHLPVWTAEIGREGWYGFPALPNGIVKVANHGRGRRVHPDAPREVTDEEVARCRSFLRDVFPALAAAPLAGTRLCLYCDTWDSDFFIDHDPSRPNLIVATGDSGHAFKFAPTLGAIIADIVEGTPNPYASRFAWREPPSGVATTRRR